MATDIRTTEIDYPTSDGKPMAETDWHINLLLDMRQRLAAWYANRPDVYVAGNLMVYYEPGKPRVFLSPGTFVAFGVPAKERLYYQTWIEGKYPDVVFEYTSRSTRREDLGKKFRIYQDVWKVREYFLFDPLDEHLKPSLQGYELRDDKLVPIELVNGILTSRVLGITISRDGTMLRLRDVTSGQLVLTVAEQRTVAAQQQAIAAQQQTIAAQQQAASERLARESAEAEVARLKAELTAIRKRKTT